ncbi:MAG: DUF393 domain-containing protein [Ignavibacteriae bacterium]|nr:DUF393 domain-containing protein [Ignavibacteriota bacterium]
MKSITTNGTLLYDASCGVCSRGVLGLKKLLIKKGIEIAPLQEQWVKEKLNLTETELLQDVRLLLNDGTLIEGANVYRYTLRKTWWTFPVYLLSVLPLFRSLFDWGYRVVARNRFKLSRKCSVLSIANDI